MQCNHIDLDTTNWTTKSLPVKEALKMGMTDFAAKTGHDRICRGLQILTDFWQCGLTNENYPIKVKKCSLDKKY